MKNSLLLHETRPVPSLPPSLDGTKILDNLAGSLFRHRSKFVRFERFDRFPASVIFGSRCVFQFRRIGTHASSLTGARLTGQHQEQ